MSVRKRAQKARAVTDCSVGGVRRQTKPYGVVKRARNGECLSSADTRPWFLSTARKNIIRDGVPS